MIFLVQMQLTSSTSSGVTGAVHTAGASGRRRLIMSYTCTRHLLHLPNLFAGAGVLVLLQFRKKIFFLQILLVHNTAVCLCSRCGAVGRPVTSFSVDFTDFGAGVQVSSLATFAGF